MSAPVVIWSETNGGSGATPLLVANTTDGIQSIQFASIDSPSSVAGLSSNHQVAPNANSFEKWLRLKLTSAAPNNLGPFAAYFNSTPLGPGIYDSAGATTVTIKYALNATYAAPTSAASSIATHNSTGLLGAFTTAPLNAPTNAVGQYSGFVTLQAQIAAGAAQGAAQFPVSFLDVSYSWS